MAERAAKGAADPQAAWTVSQRQPWADKTVEPARPTAEQLEWLEQEGFIKDEEEKDKEVMPLHCRNMAAASECTSLARLSPSFWALCSEEHT